MFKLILINFFMVSCVGGTLQHETGNSEKSTTMPIDTSKTIHSFTVEGIDGNTIRFSDFKGKKILIVNTASQCGYTPQYSELESLYKTYNDKLVVVGFPANNFGQQEPGTNQEIKSFCSKNFGVSFPMAAKISLKGSDMAPIYQWLTEKKYNGVLDARVSWNFNKFLLDENGHLLEHFDSGTSPMGEEITKFLR